MYLYTGRHSPASPLCSNASAGNAHLVGSSYIRQLSEQMIISQENIKLLKCIGQGRQVYHILHGLSCWTSFPSVLSVCGKLVYMSLLKKHIYLSFIGYPDVVLSICHFACDVATIVLGIAVHYGILVI